MEHLRCVVERITYQNDLNGYSVIKCRAKGWDALERLKKECGCNRLTVQSGGTVNGLFLREKLLDFVDIVVAPILIGGRETPTLIDGRSLVTNTELDGLVVLSLIECSKLQDSYIRLRYKVIS